MTDLIQDGADPSSNRRPVLDFVVINGKEVKNSADSQR